MNCALVNRSGFSGDLTNGLLDQDPSDGGRLVLGGGCTSATTSVNGYTIDNSELFGNTGNPLVFPANTGSGLLTAVEADTTPTAGRITDRAFRCGRLGLLPVMNAAPSAPGTLTDDAPIIGYTYGWIDNEDLPGGGLHWKGTAVDGLRIHVLDPGWFNPIIVNSPVVTKYLGAGLPVQVVQARG